MQPDASWQHYLPLLMIGIVLVIRLRRVNRARPMHLWLVRRWAGNARG